VAAQDLGLGTDVVQAGMAQGSDGGDVGGDDPVHDRAAVRVIGAVGVVAGGVQGQQPE
jgi:hypothetical protein